MVEKMGRFAQPGGWYLLHEQPSIHVPKPRGGGDGRANQERIMRRNPKFIVKPMTMAQIVSNSEVFDERYVPDVLVGRQQQIDKFRGCLRPLLENKAPLHALLFGRPGTGKTLTARMLLDELSQRAKFDTCYINCWESPTLYAVLDRLVENLKLFRAERSDATYKLGRIKEYLSKSRSQLVIVLDEIDSVEPRHRNDILYNLLQLPKTSLVCVANTRSFFVELDERIVSRFSPVHVECPAYGADDVHAILTRRAELGLARAGYDNDLLALVAERCQGDARVALRALHKAAQIAENNGRSQIDPESVDKAFEEIKQVRRKYLLEKLTNHHRAIYRIVQANPGINSTALYEVYLQESDKAGQQPIAWRTFRTHTKRLTDLKVIIAEPELGGSGKRVFRIAT